MPWGGWLFLGSVAKALPQPRPAGAFGRLYQSLRYGLLRAPWIPVKEETTLRDIKRDHQTQRPRLQGFLWTSEIAVGAKE